MKLEQLMTRQVGTCSAHDKLEQAARIIWEFDVGSVVVTDGERTPSGMITDRDIALADYTQGVTLRNARVQSAMVGPAVTCSLTSSLDELERKMRRSQVRRVPVIDCAGRLAGMVAAAAE